jgi:hypothetical protein
MGTPIDYIYENKLQWQPSFNGALEVPGRFGYRGALVVTPGKSISPEKQMPPKVMLKHAIAITDDTVMLMLAAELENFDDFAAAFEGYKSLLNADTLVTFFVNDLLSDALFDYEGIPVYAFSLDESSVWNELIDHADLEKRELKRMGAEEKLDTLYDGLKASTLRAPKLTYAEAFALKMS